MNRTGYALLAALLLWLAMPAHAAQDLFIARTARPFPEAMASAQQAIADSGYQVVRVQRVDVGLSSSGFKTAEYRLIFFGRTQEMQELPRLAPELMAYMPLKMVIFAEGETTVMVIQNPAMLSRLFPQPALRPYFQRWEKDVRALLDRIVRER
jgi:uncharacterized protein (DUF302 family)